MKSNIFFTCLIIISTSCSNKTSELNEDVTATQRQVNLLVKKHEDISSRKSDMNKQVEQDSVSHDFKKEYKMKEDSLTDIQGQIDGKLKKIDSIKWELQKQ